MNTCVKNKFYPKYKFPISIFIKTKDKKSNKKNKKIKVSFKNSFIRILSCLKMSSSKSLYLLFSGWCTQKYTPNLKKVLALRIFY